MRILLIEDDEILTAVLVEALEQQRYAVDTVDDGRFGLEYAEGGTYDLLLVDVGLPRLDGISLTQQLRNEGCQNADSADDCSGRARRKDSRTRCWRR